MKGGREGGRERERERERERVSDLNPIPFPPQPFRIRIATEFTIITESFMAHGNDASLENVRCPHLLTIHSKADTFVEPLASSALFERGDFSASRSFVHMGGGCASLPSCIQPRAPPTCIQPRVPPLLYSDTRPSPPVFRHAPPYLYSATRPSPPVFSHEGEVGELHQAGKRVATKALEKIKDLGMWHALAAEPRCEEVAAAIAEWVGACAR